MPRYINGLGALVRIFAEKAVESRLMPRIVAADAAEVLEGEVREAFGKSVSEGGRLADLAEATQESRERRGFAPNEPLVETGALRESIESGVELGVDVIRAGVGSRSPVLAYHSVGYINARTGKSVPPRNVFLAGLEEARPRIERAIGEVVTAFLSGKVEE